MSLIPAHVAELQSSTIDQRLITGRGYISIGIESREALLAARFPTWATGPDESYPLLFVPMYGPSGTMTGAQIKPAVPPIHPSSGKAMKYASRKNSPNILDVHPVNAERIRDVREQLWITEGIKKGDALTSRGACVATLSGVFNWRSKLGTIGDWEDVPLKGRSVVVCFDSDARTNNQVLNAMKRLGNWLVGRGVAEVMYVVVPSVDGSKVGVDDFFAGGGTMDQLRDVTTATVPVSSVPSDPSFTDAYLAGGVADDRLEGSYLYSPGLGGWQHWDGKRWSRCGTEAVIEEVRLYAMEQHAATLAEYAADTGSDRLKRKLEGWRSVLARTKLTSVEFLCRGIIAADVDDFDSFPDLLNVGNGVVDLATGELIPHDPDLKLTRLAPVNYVPGAEHADWKQVLGALPEDIHDWYQLRMGQSVTGESPADDYLIVQVGTGSNGKSLMADAVAAALGDYHAQISHRALISKSDAHPTELMSLKGARVGLIEETPEGRRLDVTSLKRAVGTARVKARYMRQDDQTFEATHTLFLNTNFLPQIEETDWGTWRRLLLVKFPYRWRLPSQPLERAADRMGDPDLKRRMKLSPDGQQEAVLAWLVAGSVRYHRDGMRTELPARVVSDTQEWRDESDVLGAYLRMRIAQTPGSWVLGKDLLDDFNNFLRDRGQMPWSDKLLSSRLKESDTFQTSQQVIRTDRAGRSVTEYGGSVLMGSRCRAWVDLSITHW